MITLDSEICIEAIKRSSKTSADNAQVKITCLFYHIIAYALITFYIWFFFISYYLSSATVHEWVLLMNGYYRGTKFVIYFLHH